MSWGLGWAKSQPTGMNMYGVLVYGRMAVMYPSMEPSVYEGLSPMKSPVCPPAGSMPSA